MEMCAICNTLYAKIMLKMTLFKPELCCIYKILTSRAQCRPESRLAAQQ